MHEKKNGSMAAVADLLTEIAGLFAHLDGDTPGIEPRKAGILGMALTAALQSELGITSECDCAGCDCKQSTIDMTASVLTPTNAPGWREDATASEPHGDILGLLSGGMLHPMDFQGREVSA